ncbi:hypothetical protein [Luteolibacter luteus]|uniref:Uncharacterized protein n=1 Tax=Luteolibacter luteus TaxID=2728835 RepID=A0A858RKP2_9BACT|nr:hypothetical protein [Luteolibacter luteus]QJE97422.1 hypothetical protein HHL09_17060 [Luteolibacter luteus]
MSLRAFHIVFVTVSTLLFVFLAVWSLAITRNPTGIITVLGVVSAVCALVMPAYGVFFYRKVRNIHI